MPPKKSQAAFEFIVLAGVMMAIFVMFFAIAGERIVEMNEARRDKIAQDIIDTIMAELELAHDSLDGYSRNFTLPQYIEGNEYELSIHNLGGGKNMLILFYMGEIYNTELALDLEGVGNTVYKGVNQVKKTEGKITIVNGGDPCNDLTIGDKSYCVGGGCYCYPGYYAPEGVCEHEDDFDLGCEPACDSFDYCNPAPGIKGRVNIYPVTDTTANLAFDTNESAAVAVAYDESGEGCLEWNNMDKEARDDNLKTTFDIELVDMHAVTEYCFRIKVTDSKGASQIYDTNIVPRNIFTTIGDVSAPMVRYALVFPPLTLSEPYHLYNQEVEIFVNITDNTSIDWGETRARIKQKQEDGSEKEVKVLDFNDLDDTSSECMKSPAPVEDTEYLEEIHDDDGYVKCFFTDNEFARYASYSLDEHTLFYAPYDTVFDYGTDPPEIHAAIGTVTTTENLLDKVDIVPARFGNGTKMGVDEKLSYTALSHKTRKNIDTEKGTIELWFRPIENLEKEQYFFYLGDETQTNVFSLYRLGNTLEFSIKSPSHAEPWTVNSGTLILSTDKWYFVAITWDNIGLGTDDGEMNMYFNGEEVDEQIDVNTVFSVGAEDFYVGSYPTRTPEIPNAANARAIIDQFRILDQAKENIMDDYKITRTYVIYFETNDRGYGRTYTPDDFKVSSFPVNYATQ